MSDIRKTPDHQDERHQLDYELDERVDVDTVEGLKAVADRTRTMILDLVLERAASTTELAEALGKPRGTVAHHLKILERAGLVRAVRTRKVRAMTESYWGRTARTVVLSGAGDQLPPAHRPDPAHGTYFVAEALREMRANPTWPEELPQFSTLRHARISVERAKEFMDRLYALSLEFMDSPRQGDTTFALLLAAFPSSMPTLKDPS